MSLVVNPLVAAVAEPPIAEAHGWIAGRTFPDDKPLLDCAQAVPSYPPAEPLRNHLSEVVKGADAALYTPILGLPQLRATLAGHMAEAYGADIAPEQVGITAGCNQAYCVAVNALAGPGDEVILPAPWYFNHKMWLDMQGITAVPLPCPEERGAVPDPKEAAKLIGERTKAIVLVTPNNPTGAIYPPDTIAAFYDLARERGVALILDETYKDFRADDAPAHDLFSRPGWQDTLVQLYSFSKVYSLAGYRTGSVIGSPELLEAVARIMDCITICAPRLGQEGALFGLDNLADWRAGKREMMNSRVAALREAFRGSNCGYGVVSSGAYFAWLRHPFEGRDASDVARMLAQEHNLLSLPGGMFGPGQGDYLRLAFANLEAAKMPEVVARLAASSAGY